VDRTEYPLVTVIMPIRNEALFIARSLGAVLAQRYPSDRLEILVVDGMSADETPAIIQRLPGAGRVRILPNHRQIQAAALNIGLQEARGDIVVRVDGHTVIAPDYVDAALAALETSHADAVGGAMVPVAVTSMGKAIAAASTSAFGVPAAFHHSKSAQFTDTVYLGVWPRHVLTRVGGFNESVHPNEDYELNYRIRRSGGKVYFDPRIRSIYYGRQTLGALITQYFRYGRSKVRTISAHPASLRLRHLAAPLFISYLIVGLPLAIVSLPIRVLWLAGLALYAALAAIAALRQSTRTSIRLFWRILVVFPAMHLAWGSGFWIGLAQTMQARAR
jgi:glycosyltransferase involved in cell wall biosynthesis